MKTNPFKNFITYSMAAGLLGKLQSRNVIEYEIEPRMSVDPTGSMWSTMGFVSPDGSEEFVVPLTGTGAVLLAVQLNERILPAKVRDEHMKKRLDDIMEREGRKPTKSEYASLRDDVESEQLPKSHIRRTVIPILVFSERIVFFTSSAKRATDLAAIMWSVAQGSKVDTPLLPATAKESVTAWLTALVKGEDDSPFAPMTSGVLRHTEDTIKSVVRIKDKDLDDADIQALLVDNKYRVSELRAYVMEGHSSDMDGVEGVEFTINDKLVVKGMKFPDLAIREAIGEAGEGDDLARLEFQGMAHLVASSVSKLIYAIFEATGGEDRGVYDQYDEL